jgi:primosomal protein N'
MYVVEVMPILRGGKKERLSYFCATRLPQGSIASVPVRGKSVPALIVDAVPVADLKSAVRSSRYALKKIRAGTPVRRLFSDGFREALADIARFHAASESETLFSLVPQAILERFRTIESPKETEAVASVASERLILQAPRDERFGTYRSLIRESFARDKSIFFLVPTIQDGDAALATLSKGIEKRALFLHAGLPAKKLVASWNRAATAEEPLLVIATGSFLSLPLAKTGTLIVERESASAYTSLARPYLNMRHAAAAIARRLSLRLIVGDFPLRVETIYECKEGGKGSESCEELAPLKVRAPLAVSFRVVDTRRSPTNEAKRFTALSNELTDALADALSRGKRAFIFAARRGVAPLTVCNDCGTPITDEETGTPMTLYRSAKGNVFISHASGIVKDARTRCTHCGSWNLVSLGLGIQRIEEELARAFPKATLFSLDRDRVKNHRDAKTLMETFHAAEGAVLVGTEMALPYLLRGTALCAVASLDSLLAIPEWRAHERVFSILMSLRDAAAESVLVQTRMPEERVIGFAREGDAMGFYRAELEDRRDFDYPPFSLFIALSWQGSKAAVERVRAELAETFKEYEFIAHVPALASGTKKGAKPGTFGARALVRLTRKEWPDEKLLALLASLRPEISVQVDPQELL